MSTRSCIAERKGDHWEGVYHHSDGYPSGLGCYLFRLIRYQYNGDVGRFLDGALKHDGGWSHIFPSEYGGDLKKSGEPKPECYCHGYLAKRDGTKPGQRRGVIRGCECNEKPYDPRKRGKGPSCDPLFIEWVYVFDRDTKKMAILEHFGESIPGTVLFGSM